MQEYLFPTLENGTFFCYLGCSKLFISKLGLMRHYLTTHYDGEGPNDLHEWGIDMESLRLQVGAIKAKPKRDHGKQEQKRRDWKALRKAYTAKMMQQQKA